MSIIKRSYIYRELIQITIIIDKKDNFYFSSLYFHFLAAFNYEDRINKRMWFDPCDAKPKYIEVNFTCVEQSKKFMIRSFLLITD